MRPTLSVLVASVHTRWDTFAQAIQAELFRQYAALSREDQARVDIVIFTDTKARTVGHKRNQMVTMAVTDYVVFVDDDDRVAPDYIQSLLDAIVDEPDVVTFLADVSINGGPPKVCRYSLWIEADSENVYEYRRRPNHICAVKRRLAMLAGYPMEGIEDVAYATNLAPLTKTEVHIDRVLYFYDFNSATTETQGNS